MLEAAHRGYLFQDLVTAIYLSRSILDSDIRVTVDVKSFTDDRFDDLKIESLSRLELVQIKRSDGRDFSINDLSSDQRGLRLDYLFASWDSERKKNEGLSTNCLILTNWRKPSSPPEWLRQVDQPNLELPTGGVCFEIDLGKCSQEENGRLCRHLKDVNPQNLELFLSQLTLVLEVPDASLDLNEAGKLERSLLETLKDRIGVGVQPNEHISPIDAAGRLIHRAGILRSSNPELSSITGSQVIPILGLVTNFGALPQDFPFLESEFVGSATRQETLDKLIVFGSVSVLRAGPGSGKSWELTNHLQNLEKQGVKVAKHYCYISPSDVAKESRVTRKTLLGNLISAIKPLLPEVGTFDLPLYSATEETFQKALQLLPESSRLVILVDGLDHILRVRALAQSLSVEETNIVDLISCLEIPPNVSIVIGSQPGSYLDALAGERLTLDLPPWEDTECIAYLKNLLSLSGDSAEDRINSQVLYFKQTQGIPLFCNYLIRQVAQLEPIDWAEVHTFLSEQPLFSGDLKNYYDYIFNNIPVEGQVILRRLGMLDFGITVEELGEMTPIMGSFLDKTLKVALPVLSPITNSNGIRIYHESFRRFVLEQIEDVSDSEWSEVASWLEKQGFFDSFRSFLYLFPYLQRANRSLDLIELVDEKFVTLGVAAGFASELIKRNLNLWLGVISEQGRYDLFGRSSELQNALSSLDWDLYDYTEYAKAACCIYGSKKFGERMIFEGQPLYSQEDGLKICAVLHSLGGFAPWAIYFSSHAQPREHEISGNNYEVSKARFLGRIVLDGIEAGSNRLVEFLSGISSDSKVSCQYIEGLVSIFQREGGSLEKLKNELDVGSLPKHVQSSLLLVEARTTENEAIRDGNYRKVLGLSGDSWQLIEALDHVPDFKPSSKISKGFDSRSDEILNTDYPNDHSTERWGFEIRALARSHPELLKAQRSLITGDWWYRNWLRFMLDFTVAEASSGTVLPEKAFQLLQILTRSTEPFLGEPRACDLYQIRNCIHWSIERCLRATTVDEKLFRKALILLREMSFETTTYLQSSAGGPLVPTVLFETCLSLSEDLDIQAIVSEEMRPLVSRMELGSTYPQIAEEKLKVTSLSFHLGLSDYVKSTWKEATRYLTAYGERKDSTLEEVLAPTIILNEVDSVGSYERLRKCQELSYAVCRHTDGKGTGHFISEWFSNLSTLFPRSAGEIFAESQSSEGGPYDYRIEEGLTSVLESIETSDDHLLLAAILTVQGGLSTSLESRLDSMRQNLANLPVCFSDLVTAKIQGDAFGSNKDSLGNQKSLSKPFGYPDIWVSDEKAETGSNTSRVSREKISPVFSEKGKVEVETFKVEVEKHLKNYEVSKTELHEVATSIMRRLCDSRAVAEGLLDWMCNDLYRSESSELMEILGGVAEDSGWTDLAARGFALAFCHCQGSGGWLAFGDAKKHSILQKSYKLDGSVSETVFREEIVRQNGSRGVTQHVIGGLVSLGRVENAKKMWEEAYKVIQWRLPSKAEAGPFSYLPLEETEKSSKEILIIMIFSRLSNPEETRRKSAMMAAVWCIQNRPLLVGAILGEICHGKLRTDVLILILSLVERYEKKPWKITQTGKDSLSLICRSGDFAPAQIAEVLLGRAQLKTPTKTGSEIEIKTFGGQFDPRMLRFLDRARVLAQVEDVWPGITEEVMCEIKELLHEDGSDRDRWKSLVQMSHDTVYKEIPPARVVEWPEVVFARVVNQKLRGLKEKLWLTGNPKSDLENQIAESLRPDVIEPAKYQLSRIPRPNFATPDEVEGEIKAFDLGSEGALNEWVEIGKIEYLMASDEDGFGRISQTILAVSGMVQLHNNQMMPKGAIPISEASAGDWERSCTTEEAMGNAYGPLAAIIEGSSSSCGNQMLGFARGFRLMFDLKPTEAGEPIGYKSESGELIAVFRWWSCDPIGGSNGIVKECPRLQGGVLLMLHKSFEDFKKGQTGNFIRVSSKQVISEN